MLADARTKMNGYASTQATDRSARIRTLLFVARVAIYCQTPGGATRRWCKIYDH